MIRDILLEANVTYKFCEKVHDPVEYAKLNDNIIHEIKYSQDVKLKRA